MSTVQTLKIPVNRGVNMISEKDLEFFVETLTREDRKKIFDLYGYEFKGTLSRTAIYKLTRGETHLSNENIIWLMKHNSTARKFIAEMLWQRALQILHLAEIMMKDDVEIEWPEDEEEAEEE
ncbi:hypothetical protein [Sulfurisphaera ohwakuensis]|uniref:hypothetical protein n=1 Tax=Sulfurisphaera ohwakuensis TaxID=69656 RepID=UPI0036F1FF7E